MTVDPDNEACVQSVIVMRSRVYAKRAREIDLKPSSIRMNSFYRNQRPLLVCTGQSRILLNANTIANPCWATYNIKTFSAVPRSYSSSAPRTVSQLPLLVRSAIESILLYGSTIRGCSQTASNV